MFLLHNRDIYDSLNYVLGTFSLFLLSISDFKFQLQMASVSRDQQTVVHGQGVTPARADWQLWQLDSCHRPRNTSFTLQLSVSCPAQYCFVRLFTAQNTTRSEINKEAKLYYIPCLVTVSVLLIALWENWHTGSWFSLVPAF